MKEIQCKARNGKKIKLEGCIPNPDHTACKNCDSPKNVKDTKQSDREKIKKKFLSSGSGDIEDPEIQTHIYEFKILFDLEVSRRLNRAWIRFLNDVQEYLANHISTCIEECLDKRFPFSLEPSEPFIKVKFKNDMVIRSPTRTMPFNIQGEFTVPQIKFEDLRGSLSNDALATINATFAELQNICLKSANKTKGKAVTIQIKGVNKTLPLYRARFYNDPKKKPRKSPSTNEAILDRAINALIDNLGAKYPPAAIKLIFEYYDIMKYLHPTKDRIRQIANRYQRKAIT